MLRLGTAVIISLFARFPRFECPAVNNTYFPISLF